MHYLDATGLSYFWGKVKALKDVFWAEYGVTTYSEIEAAFTAGKHLIGHRDNRCYGYAYKTSGLWCFRAFDSTYSRDMLIYVDSSDRWQSGTTTNPLKAVLYGSSQSLSDAYKQQARTNIGAASASDVDILINRPHNYAYDGGNLLTRFGSVEAIHQAVAANDFSRIFVGDYIPVTLNGSYLDPWHRVVPVGTQIYSDPELTTQSSITDQAYTVEFNPSRTWGVIQDVGYVAYADCTASVTNTINEQVLLEVASINPYINSGDASVGEFSTPHLLLVSRDCLSFPIEMDRSQGNLNGCFYNPSAPDPWLGSAMYSVLNDANNGILPILLSTELGPYIYSGPNGNGQAVWWADLAYGVDTPTSASHKARGRIFLPTETEVFGAQFFQHDRYSIGSMTMHWEIFNGSFKHLVKHNGNGGQNRVQWWTCTPTRANRFAVFSATGNLGERTCNNPTSYIPLCTLFV